MNEQPSLRAEMASAQTDGVQTHGTQVDEAQTSSVLTGMKRGVRHRCPNCGEGRLYTRYLKVDLDCEVCGHDLARYPADDGPAYFTILIVGHLFVAPLLLFPFIWKMSPALVVPLTVLPLAGLTLLLLPRVKGAVIGALWAIGLRKAQDCPSG